MQQDNFLELVIMNYVSKKLALKDIGFSSELVFNISELTIGELFRLISILNVSVSVDKSSIIKIENLLNHFESERELSSLKKKSISLGAPNSFMKYFFGMHHGDVTELRKNMGFQLKAGRIKVLSENDKDLILSKIGFNELKSDKEILKLILSFCDSNFKLREVWHFLEEEFSDQLSKNSLSV